MSDHNETLDESVSPPLVSVIVPAYNQVGFIEEALLSAVEQDYENLEVIAADDGSTDSTDELILEIARNYPKRLTALVGKGHLGITGNCNRALSACRGKYVSFHAGDDVLLPGKIRKQVEWLEEDPRRVLCGHDVEFFSSATGKRLYLWSDLAPLRAGCGARRVIRWGMIYPGVSIMVRASRLPPSGYDERILVSSDAKLWIDCLREDGRYGHIEGVYARYRRHDRNVGQWELYWDMLHMLGLVLEENSRFERDVKVGKAHAYFKLAVMCRGKIREGIGYLAKTVSFGGAAVIPPAYLLGLLLRRLWRTSELWPIGTKGI